jgi:hypothetical protein
LKIFRDRRSIEWKRRFWRRFSGLTLAFLFITLLAHFVVRVPVWYRNENRALTDWEVLLFMGGPAVVAWLIFHQNRRDNPIFHQNGTDQTLDQ